MNTINNSLNIYQDISAYQRKDIPFVKPEHPVYPEQPIIDEIELSPEAEMNIQRAKEEAKAEEEAQKQAKEEELRALMAQYTKERSIQTQIEIYLSVSTDTDVSLGNDLDLLNTLRDLQSQNDSMHGYETYKSLQENKEEFFTT